MVWITAQLGVGAADIDLVYPLSAHDGEDIGRHLRDAAQSRSPRDGDACFPDLGDWVDEVEIAGLRVRREDEPCLRGRRDSRWDFGVAIWVAAD